MNIILFLWILIAFPFLYAICEKRDELTRGEFVAAMLIVYIGAPIIWIYALCKGD